MQIAELFDELNEQELNELLELPLRDDATVSVHAIRRRINRALDKDPAERRIHMKQTYKKGICAALIAAVLLTGALAAASRLNLLRGWLQEDNIGDLVINTEKQSIDNGDLRLTIEESLADETMTYVAYSLTALTEKGQAILDGLQQDENTAYVTTGDIVAPTDISSIDTLVQLHADASTKATNRAPREGSIHTESLPDASQPGRLLFRSYFLGCGEVYLTLNGTVERLHVPQTVNVQSADITFGQHTNVPLPNGTEGTFYSLRLTSLGYALDAYAWYADQRTQNFDLEYMLTLLMKDGSIRTMTQLATTSSTRGTGRWNEVLDLKTVEAVILNDTAYYLDGREPTPYELPDNLKIIRLEPTEIYTMPGQKNEQDYDFPILGIPAEQLLTPLGGKVDWNTETQTAVLTLGDRSCTVTVGSPDIQYDDSDTITTSLYPSAAEVIDGTLYLGPIDYERALGIRCCGSDHYTGDPMDTTDIKALYYTI